MATACDSDDLERCFENATHHLETIVASLDDNQKLHFYARFKQAKEGSCNVPKPSFLNFAAKRKWLAWKELGEMSRDQAMQEYIDGIVHLDPEWDPSAKDESQKSISLGLAVSTLRQNSEDIIPDVDKTAFDWVKEGNIEQIKKIFDEGRVDVNEFDDEGMSYLHWASDRGHAEIVELLIQKGADVNLKESDGQTPLHYASSCGHIDTISILLKFNADLKLRDNDDLSPLDVACDSNVAAILSR